MSTIEKIEELDDDESCESGIEKLTLESSKAAPKTNSDVHNLEVELNEFVVRCELIDTKNLTEFVVARIQKSETGFDAEILRENGDPEHWKVEDELRMFPVGYAILNHIRLKSDKDYINYSKGIASQLIGGKKVNYENDDLSFFDAANMKSKSEILEAEQYFEFIDPVDQNPKAIRIAMISEIFENVGMMKVTVFGKLEGGEIKYLPLCLDTECMYPIGHHSENNLELEKPAGFKNKEKWNRFLEKIEKEQIPKELFEEGDEEDSTDTINHESEGHDTESNTTY